MATLDEIFAAMPDTPAGGTHELLVIDPDTRQIEVPEIESIFGVVTDGNAEKKFFQCPRYVGKGIDLAACKLRIAYQNASGTEEGRDGYLVQDLTESDGYVYFSWELSEKVCLFQGPVQFAVCAILGSTVVWNTDAAEGRVLAGLQYNGEIIQTEMQDVIAQLLALVEAQSKAVEAVGAEQAQNVQAACAAAVVEINAAAANAAPAIVCEAEGTAITLADASDRPFMGLRIFGKSTQDGTPTPDNPVEIVSTQAPVVTITDGTEENVQTLALVNGLPGIPVASGGNYTDANGQQWICDEVDLGRGVHVQRIGEITLQNDRIYFYNADTAGKEFFYTADNNNAEAWETRMLCSHFPIIGGGVGMSSDYWAQFSGSGGIRLRHKDITSVNEFITWISANLVNICYVLADPIETPLSEAELAAFAALRSVNPTTTILNDSGAHMAVEYVADTKLYIDRKLAELVAAMNA